MLNWSWFQNREMSRDFPGNKIEHKILPNNRSLKAKLAKHLQFHLNNSAATLLILRPYKYVEFQKLFCGYSYWGLDVWKMGLLKRSCYDAYQQLFIYEIGSLFSVFSNPLCCNRLLPV